MTLNREDYLLVIWEYLEAFGKVSEKDLANRLRISPPTAHEYLEKLSQDGLIVKSRGDLSFTKKGQINAAELVRMHRISEVFAFKFLEVPWEDTHMAVMELEHIFKGERAEKLYKNLGQPSTCPHGNPTEPRFKLREIPLSISDPGNYRILRITYEDGNLLKIMAEQEMYPGTQVSMIKEQDAIILENGHGSIKIPYEIAMSVRLEK
ncbi:MAG: metal-dependent transcriptional regulator [Thermoplasmataceae archaeon]